MKVRELMTEEVATCGPDDSLNEAARLMWEKDCGCIPIIDEQQRVIGIITDRDICMGAFFHGTPLKDVPIGMVMSSEVFCCHPDDKVEKAEQLMDEYQIRRVPVISDDSRLEGILSLNDIALAYKHDGKRIGASEVADTLAQVSTHYHPMQPEFAPVTLAVEPIL